VKTPQDLNARAFAFPLRLGERAHRLVLGAAHSVEAPSLEKALHPSERKDWTRAAPVRQESFLLGRVAGKRALLHEKAAQPWDELAIGRGVFGQPIADGADLSLSHAEGQAFALVYERGMVAAVDVERWLREEEEIDAVLEQLTSDEVRRLAPRRDVRVLTALWSAREALAKALRCGLVATPSVLEIAERLPFPPGGTSGGRVAFTHFPHLLVTQFTLPLGVLSLALPSEGRADWEEVARRIEGLLAF
jgi:phosphopantetheinyl transferase